MEQTESVLHLAKGIGDYGMMMVTAAFFLLLSGGMMVACFAWFRQIVNSIINKHEEVMNKLLQETRQQNETLADINEGLRPISQMQITSVCNNFFDLDCERLCRLIKAVREENSLSDHEKTRTKIETRCGAIFKNRSVEFDNFMHRGKRLSEFMSMDWIAKFSDIIESEVYNPSGANNARAYANIKTGIDEIKVDFFNNMNR